MCLCNDQCYQSHLASQSMDFRAVEYQVFAHEFVAVKQKISVMRFVYKYEMQRRRCVCVCPSPGLHDGVYPLHTLRLRVTFEQILPLRLV